MPSRQAKLVLFRTFRDTPKTTKRLEINLFDRTKEGAAEALSLLDARVHSTTYATLFILEDPPTDEEALYQRVQSEYRNHKRIV